MSRNLTNFIACSFLLLLHASPGIGQDPPEPISMQDLQQMLLDQQKLIEQQAEELAKTQEEMKALQTQMDTVMSHAGQAEDVSSETVALRERLSSVEQELRVREGRQGSEDKQANVSEFPGSFPIPGTNMSAKIGGNVRLGLVSNLDPIGSDDRFITGSIPVGEPEPGTTTEGFTISAKRSRMNLDMRMDSSVGQFRAFIEGDFAAEANNQDTYRLRHAFGQYKNWIMGQTWSTFMDTRALPEELDFEGLNAQLIDRQPVLRWAKQFDEDRVVAVSLEDPSAEITGGEGKGKFADVAARVSKQREWGHLQAAMLLRNISGSPDNDPEANSSTFGWGLSLSGGNRFKRWSQLDNFKFQINLGQGIGRYINDLDSVGGQDAVFDPEGDLKAIPVLGAFFAYQHFWKRDPTTWFSKGGLLKDLRSTLVLGYTQVDNYDFQADDAYRRTKRISLNLLWSPINSIDIGMEFLWGERMNKNGERGNAGQFQLVGTFFF